MGVSVTGPGRSWMACHLDQETGSQEDPNHSEMLEENKTTPLHKIYVYLVLTHGDGGIQVPPSPPPHQLWYYMSMAPPNKALP